MFDQIAIIKLLIHRSSFCPMHHYTPGYYMTGDYNKYLSYPVRFVHTISMAQYIIIWYTISVVHK